MDIDLLLKNDKVCSCGKRHTVDIEKTIIESGAVDKLNELTEEYERVLLVSDSHTYKACGEQVKDLLGDKIETNFVFECEGFLVPDEKAVEVLRSKISSDTDLVIGVGSGVINDLCKYVSFLSDLPYFIVATAPSMDGYASTGAAMIFKNMKVTFHARVPKAIIADTTVLKNAPSDLIKAGYGDIIGKYSALNDWKLGHVVLNEYFCSEVYDLVMETTEKTVSLAPGLKDRKEDSIETLMEALVITGIAMSYVGNSRPASGSEHHFSHFFEVVGLLNNEPYLLHGIDVAFSAVETQKIREKLLNISKPSKFRIFDRNLWEENIKRVYGKGAAEIIALQDKIGRYEQSLNEIYISKWEEIKSVLEEAPKSEQIKGLLEDAGLNYEDFLNIYGKEKLADAYLYAKDCKDRYTVLWPYYSILG
jgi:glycerol-1-phosphate dehydrogenase [NAD(P)+]